MAQKGRRGGVKAWLVEPYFQIRLGLMVVLLNLIFTALIGAVFFYYMYDVYEAISTYFKLTDAQAETTMSKFAQPIIAAAVLMVVFVICTFIVSVRYTHQVYGPLVSIHRYLDDCIGGKKPSPLKLRASDQLNDLAEKLNIMGSSDQKTSPADTSELEKVVHFVECLQRGEKVAPPQVDQDPELSRLVQAVQGIAQQSSHA